MEQIEGIVEEIVYRSDKGWAVTRATVNGNRETVVGMIGHLPPGTTVVYTGEWINSRKFGRQFDARSAETVTPQTVAGIRRYLETLDHCGPSRAQSIVDAHGAEALERIWGGVEALTSIPGIGAATARAIRASAIERRSEAEAMVGLAELKVPERFHSKLIDRYGHEAADRVREDPYNLIRMFEGVGFKIADAIAQQAGIPTSSASRIQAGILHCMRQSRSDGHTFLTRTEMAKEACMLLGLKRATVEDELIPLERDGDLVVDGEAIYLKVYHQAEEEAAEDLLRIIRADTIKLPLEARPSIVPFPLDIVQTQAVEAARENKVVVITGGPGTGKTTICRVILTAFRGMSVELASPTGRAAKRLSEATGRSAQTIHRLLEYHPNEGWRRNRHNQLTADVVLLDEVSMVDIVLLSRLLEAMPSHARLIMVGDADQLPSVGPGKVLADTIDSGVVPCVELTQIQRQGSASRIVVNAHRVNNGEPLDLPDHSEESDMYMIRRQDKHAAAELAVELASRILPAKFGFDPLEDVWVITPQNKGPAGVDELNIALQSKLNPDGQVVPFLKKKQGFRVGDRVMQWKNNYDIAVFNGETGRIVGFDLEEEMMTVRVDDRDVLYDKATAAQLRLAYATTVHKSQGSEYPCVVMVVHRTHFRMLQRPLLYTGMTRARQLLVIVGQEEAVEVATKTAGKRHRNSGLGWRLGERQGKLVPTPPPPAAEPADNEIHF